MSAESRRQPAATQPSTVAEMSERITQLESQVAFLLEMNKLHRGIDERNMIYLASYMASVMGWQQNFPNLPRRDALLTSCMQDSLSIARAAIATYESQLPTGMKEVSNA